MPAKLATPPTTSAEVRSLMASEVAHDRIGSITVTNEEYKELQRRIDADIERVSRDYARERTKRKATKKPRKQSWKKFVEQETWAGVKKDGAQ